MLVPIKNYKWTLTRSKNSTILLQETTAIEEHFSNKDLKKTILNSLQRLLFHSQKTVEYSLSMLFA